MTESVKALLCITVKYDPKSQRFRFAQD
uniref:Uncharacterized protein n=1 Tax=Anguilla anguilla TaxID=7936 RepID=A0A0E9W0L3_ANGAN